MKKSYKDIGGNLIIDFLNTSYKNKMINIEIKSLEEKYFIKVNDLLVDVFENLLINVVQHIHLHIYEDQ
ncbi:MAG: hypothetical protein EU529_12470 [Promethearchaeota archaeon]|nr:MAG: hypothetical protein EU529_12470 [Candidatus Lokiarchaeota archaeon]